MKSPPDLPETYLKRSNFLIIEKVGLKSSNIHFRFGKEPAAFMQLEVFTDQMVFPEKYILEFAKNTAILDAKNAPPPSKTNGSWDYDTYPDYYQGKFVSISYIPPPKPTTSEDANSIIAIVRLALLAVIALLAIALFVLFARHRAMRGLLQRLFRRGSPQPSQGPGAPVVSASGKLTSNHKKKLQEALLSAFLERTSFEQLADFCLDMNLNEIAGELNLKDTVYKLIMWAESNGQIRKLVQCAREQNPGNEELREFAQGIGVETQAPATLTR
jgi:hypothetical protein